MKKPKLRKIKPKRKKKTRAQKRKPSPITKIQKEQAEDFSYGVFNSPFQNINEDEREKLIRGMADKSSEKYDETLAYLKDIAKQYDPLSLLSILANYATMSSLKEDGTTVSFGEELGQSQVEVIQAICLSVPLSDNKPPAPQDIQPIFDALKDISICFSFKRSADIDLKWNDEKKATRLLQERVRLNTQIVRNWGYYKQVIITLKEIFSPLDNLYIEHFGFSAMNVLDFFIFMVKKVEERITDRTTKLAEIYAAKNSCDIVYKYHEWLGLKKQKADKFITDFQVEKRDVKEVFAMVLSHADLFLNECYTFSKQDCATALALELNDSVINNIFEIFSFKFGDLEDVNTDYIFLANPVWKKPLIKISNDEVFCCIPQVFFSFALTTLDDLLRSKENRILSDHRSKYLEDKIAHIVKSRFPEATTISGLKWNIDDVQYETDLIIFIDSQIIIIEAKSGKISDTAMRGAPQRLKHNLDELLIQPNIQSLRLKKLLLELIDDPERHNPIRDKLPVDLAKIHGIHRISVSLEDFATIQTNIKGLYDTGWLPEQFEPCPTLCLGDFQTIFDIIEHPVQIIHYIQQREILEKNVDYMGDELDLLGWYIETLFNIPDFGKEFSQIIVSGSSGIIDKYYNGRDRGLEVSKPKPKLHLLFEKILKQLEERKTERWTEVGVILHMFSPNDQEKLARLLTKLKRNVEKNWKIKGHKNMLILNPAQNSKFALCYIYFNNQTTNQRYEFIDTGIAIALEPEHVKYCVVIAKNIENDTRAYDFIAIAGNDTTFTS